MAKMTGDQTFYALLFPFPRCRMLYEHAMPITLRIHRQHKNIFTCAMAKMTGDQTFYAFLLKDLGGGPHFWGPEGHFDLWEVDFLVENL